MGDFYNAYMDVENLEALGIEPLQPELDRLAALSSLEELSGYLGELILRSGTVMLAGIVPSTDRADSTRTALYFVRADWGWRCRMSITRPTTLLG